jgi:hypothetical protein
VLEKGLTYKKEQGCKKAQRRKDKLQQKETAAAGEKYIVEMTSVLTKKQEQKKNPYWKQNQ